MGYDPYQKVSIVSGGPGYVGRGEKSTWIFDCAKSSWTKLNIEHPAGLRPWNKSAEFDPEHNVFVCFGADSRAVYVFRYKDVPVGTKVKY